MLDEAQALPDDVAALKAMVLASRAELRNRDLPIEKLKHQLAGLRRQRFGATSETLDQFELGLEDEEIAQAADAVPEPTPGAKRQPKRRPLAAAIRYALTRLKRLRPYLEHGLLEIDNNPAERAIRPIALGRKNYLFMGSAAGGKAAAIAYTLIETAKLNDVDPQAWLADVLERIPDYKINRGDELLPWNCPATAQPTADI